MKNSDNKENSLIGTGVNVGKGQAFIGAKSMRAIQGNNVALTRTRVYPTVAFRACSVILAILGTVQ